MGASTSCGAKKVYYSEKEAKFARENEIARAGIPIYYYKCEYCGWYHLSHSKRKRKVYTIKSAGISFTA
jgi:hypothetical protein